MASLASPPSDSIPREEASHALTPSVSSGSLVPPGLSDEKCDKMAELLRRLGDTLPERGRDDLTIYRFLVARDWDLDDSEKMLKDHISWRKSTFPIPRSYWEKDPLFLNGAIFPHGRDKEGRPIIVVRSGLFCPNERDVDKCLKAAISCVIDMFNKQGYHSKVTIVYDRQNFSLSQHLDKPLLKGIASLFSDNFPESLHAAYLYPCGMVLRGIWAVVQFFFDEKTRNKVFMLSSPDSFKDYVDADQLISAVGGTSTYTFDIGTMVGSMPLVCEDPWEAGGAGAGQVPS